MEVKSLNRIYVFHRGLAVSNLIFFSFVLSKSMCISALEPSSSPSNFFVILLIHSTFLLCFLGAIFNPKLFGFSCIQLLLCFRVISPPFVGRISFSCFGMSCFVCIVLPFVDIFLIFLLSQVIFGLFPQVVLLFLFVLPFPFCLYMFQRLSYALSFWPVIVDFLSAFPVEFSILVLIFSSCFLRRSQFSRKLISPLHRLVYLIRLYYLLIYKLVLDQFFRFPT